MRPHFSSDILSYAFVIGGILAAFIAFHKYFVIPQHFRAKSFLIASIISSVVLCLLFFTNNGIEISLSNKEIHVLAVGVSIYMSIGMIAFLVADHMYGEHQLHYILSKLEEELKRGPRDTSASASDSGGGGGGNVWSFAIEKILPSLVVKVVSLIAEQPESLKKLTDALSKYQEATHSDTKTDASKAPNNPAQSTSPDEEKTSDKKVEVKKSNGTASQNHNARH